MFGYFQIIYCLKEESSNYGTKNPELNQVFIYPKMSRHLHPTADPQKKSCTTDAY